MSRPIIHRSAIPGFGISAGITLTLLSLVVLLPIGALLLKGALAGPDRLWTEVNTPRIWASLWLSFRLSFLAALFNLVFGVALAWVLARYRFPGREWLFRILLLGLMIPAMMLIVPQFILAKWLGLIDSLPGLIVFYVAGNLALNTFLLRGFFEALPQELDDAMQIDGATAWRRFIGLALPLARPAIAAGVALALMETVADFGVVEHFGVQTLTTGVFSTWLNGNNAGGAAQLSGVILALILVLVTIERLSRRNARFHRPSRASRPIERSPCAVLRRRRCRRSPNIWASSTASSAWARRRSKARGLPNTSTTCPSRR